MLPRQAHPQVEKILHSDWFKCVCQHGRARERWTQIWQQLWGGKKVRMEQFGRLPASSQCVWVFALHLCVYVFIKAQVQLQKIVWLLFKTLSHSLVSKSNPASAFVRPPTYWPRLLRWWKQHKLWDDAKKTVVVYTQSLRIISAKECANSPPLFVPRLWDFRR